MQSAPSSLHPPHPPPAWLRRLVERMPGSVRVDQALVVSLQTYFGEWRRLLPRALAAYIPGGVCVFLARRFGGPLVGTYVEFGVLIIGAAVLQAAEVEHVATAHTATPRRSFLGILWRLRGRTLSLLGAFAVIVLMMLVPAVVFAVVNTMVLLGSLQCTIASHGVAGACSVNWTWYASLTAIFMLAVLPLAVRWAVIVPVITLEGRRAFSGISRSWRLTAGETARLSTWIVLAVAVSAGVWELAHWLITRAIGDVPLSESLSSAVGDTLAGSFLVILLTQIYFHLLGTPAHTPTPPPLVTADDAQPSVRRRRRSRVWIWVVSWSIVFVMVASVAVVSNSGRRAAALHPPAFDPRQIVLQPAQLPGYTAQGATQTAFSGEAVFVGSSRTAFIAVVSSADVASDPGNLQALEDGSRSAIQGEPGAKQITSLPPLGSNFVAFTFSKGEYAVLMWTHGLVFCSLEVSGPLAGPLDLQRLEALARVQEANATAVVR